MSNCNKVTDSILVGAKKVIDNIIPPKDKGIYSGNVLNNKHEYFEVKKLFSELKTEAEKAKAVKNLGLEKYTAKTLLSLLENDMDFTTKEETNKAIEEKTTELKTEINNLIENLPKDTVIITNPVNAGNITKPGIYTNVVSGRPATAVDDGDTSYTIIAGGDEAKTLLAVGNISGKVWSRSNKGNWTLNIQLYLNAEGYNADLCTKPGIYDPVVLGRPEGSESDERYFLYVSPYGGQIIFSRRNSGKIYHRLGAGHPWVPVSQNDVIILQALESSLNNYGQSGYYPASELEGLTGYIDEPSMGEVYAGYNNLDITSFNVTKLIDITPNTIIAIDVFYRKGENAEQYPYDSDAYVYISNSPEKGHGIELLLSDYIKVPALGSISTTVTDLNSAHELFYTNKIRIYIKSTSIKNLPAYLHIAGDFSEKRSWLCIGDIYLYEHINIINTVEGLIDSYNFLTEEDGIIPIDLSPYINDDTQELPHTSRDTQEFSSARHYQYYFNNTPCRFIEYEGPRFVGKPVQYFLVVCYYNRSLKKYLYINFINWHYTEITDLTNDPDNNYLFGIDRLGSGDVATINGKSIVNGGNIEIPTKISLLENDLVLTEEQKELLKGPQGPAGPAGEIPNIEQLQTDIATAKSAAENAERKAEDLSRNFSAIEEALQEASSEQALNARVSLNATRINTLMKGRLSNKAIDNILSLLKLAVYNQQGANILIEEIEDEIAKTYNVVKPTIVREGNILAASAEGSVIYYTTDGTEPTIQSTLYENPITLEDGKTYTFIAYFDGEYSPIVIYRYVEVKTPVIEKRADKSVVITCETTDAVIYYTDDGTEPTSASFVYTGAFKPSADCTIKAIAIVDDNKSGIAEFAYSSKDLIQFADAEVKRVLVSSDNPLIDTDADGEISVEEAAVAQIMKPVNVGGSIFGNNTTIVSFDEFDKFTSATLGTAVFDGMSNLESITLPTHINALPNYAFRNCAKLSSINLSQIQTFNRMCLSGCKALTSIDFSSAKTLGEQCIAGSGVTGEIVVPSSITSVGSALFQGCMSLQRVIFNANIKTIPTQTFRSTNALSYIELGVSLEEIAENNFTNECAKTLVLRNPNKVVSLGTQSNSRMTIYVPDALLDAYRADAGWQALLSLNGNISTINPISQLNNSEI